MANGEWLNSMELCGGKTPPVNVKDGTLWLNPEGEVYIHKTTDGVERWVRYTKPTAYNQSIENRVIFKALDEAGKEIGTVTDLNIMTDTCVVRFKDTQRKLVII